jgi:hypothetical protein
MMFWELPTVMRWNVTEGCRTKGRSDRGGKSPKQICSSNVKGDRDDLRNEETNGVRGVVSLGVGEG